MVACAEVSRPIRGLQWQMCLPVRDTIRSTVIGPSIRARMIDPARRFGRRVFATVSALTDDKTFSCPICSYSGLFLHFPMMGKPQRRYATCPACGSRERHRLQARVLANLLPECSGPGKCALHFAPEDFFAQAFRDAFGTYTTCDLYRLDVDVRADITDLPFPDNSVDFIFASHVLEHVQRDRDAINELTRVLRPGGVAVLPVPIYSDKQTYEPLLHTVEYGSARPEEDGHVRAPGLDYFDRYRTVFEEVCIVSSELFEKDATDSQLHILGVDGATSFSLPDYVPICRKASVATR